MGKLEIISISGLCSEIIPDPVVDLMIEELCAKMAQATLKDYVFSHNISEVMKVTVVKTGDVVIMTEPEDSLLSGSEMKISRPAWNKFMTHARPKMRKALADRQTDEINYYPRTNKTAKALKSQTGHMYIELASHTQKGYMNGSINLSENEFTELDTVAIHVTAALMELSPHASKSILQVFRWRLVPKEGYDGPVPYCNEVYYTVEHAKRRGLMVALTNNVDIKLVDVEPEFTDLPNGMRFVKAVYSLVMFRACEWMAYYGCPACQQSIHITDDRHTSPEGCLAEKSDKIADHIDTCAQVVSLDFVKRVFFHCWRIMELDVIQIDELLRDLFTVWDLPHCTNHIQIALYRLREKMTIPEVDLVDDCLDSFNFKEMMLQSYKAFGPEKVLKRNIPEAGTSSDEPEKKKRKKAKKIAVRPPTLEKLLTEPMPPPESDKTPKRVIVEAVPSTPEPGMYEALTPPLVGSEVLLPAESPRSPSPPGSMSNVLKEVKVMVCDCPPTRVVKEKLI